MTKIPKLVQVSWLKSVYKTSGTSRLDSPIYVCPTASDWNIYGYQNKQVFSNTDLRYSWSDYAL